MSKARASELTSIGDRLFAKKRQLDSLCQEIAWQFCPDLADFTTTLILGEDWSSDRMDGYPELVSRELSSQIGAMLRPQDKQWFRATTMDDDLDADEENARALQYISAVVKRGLYDPRSKFIRATKETDRFYVNFGQGVMSIEEAPVTRDHLFFRNHHLKNCAWLENNIGDVDHMHRRDKMTARAMVRNFPSSKLSSAVKEAAEKEPYREFDIRVITLPSDEYDMVKSYSGEGSDGKPKKHKFVTVYVDVENNCILKESGAPNFIYVVPRWHRFAESQYAFSPSTMTSLADARMSQMLSQIILEAGEKAVDPPLIGKQDVVIGEPNIQSGAISWVDMEHDSKLTDALDVININADLRVGFEMRKDIRDLLSKSFFIDKLTLPDQGGEMTAFEVSRRLEEHIRNLLPLFEPMQVEYNSRTLDLAFETMRNMRKFDWSRIPPALSESDFTWSFESPIQRATDLIMVEQFKGSLEVMMLGAQAGAGSKPIHIDQAMRDAIRGVGGPATWRKTKEEQQEEAEAMQQEQEQAKAMAQAQQATEIASRAGDAANKLGFQPSADKMIAAQAKVGGAPQQGVPQQGVPQQGMPEGGQEDFYSLMEEDESGATEAEDGGAGANGNVMQMITSALGQGQGQGGSEIVPAQLQRQIPSIVEDLARMQQHILSSLEEIKSAVSKQRKITIKRGKDGKIESASSVNE
jgi:hypothetical protein